MSNHNDSVAFLVDIFKLFHDDVGRAGIKVTGGLVSEDDFGTTDDGTSNSNTLLLATGELIGIIIFAFLEMKTSEGTRGLFESGGSSVAGIDKGESDVFNNWKVLYEIKVLKDKADFLGAELGLATSLDTGDILAV